MVATARYGDEVRGLDERLRGYRSAVGGVDRLEAFIEFWGNYIPEIHGIARALLAARESDAAVAAAWDDRMRVVREACRDIVSRLQRDGMLASGWSPEEASEMLWSLLSIGNWENLTLERGWPVSRYVIRMQELTRRAFVGEDPAGRGRPAGSARSG